MSLIIAKLTTTVLTVQMHRDVEPEWSAHHTPEGFICRHTYNTLVRQLCSMHLLCWNMRHNSLESQFHSLHFFADTTNLFGL